MIILLGMYLWLHCHLIITPCVCYSSIAISRMTLSLFEDSEWYTVNYDAGLFNEEVLSGSGKHQYTAITAVIILYGHIYAFR